VSESHHDESDGAAAPADEHVATEAVADDETADEVGAGPLDSGASVADPRVRDAVRRLNELADLPPAEHVEVYEAVHSSLQESLAEASRQADESPEDGTASS
jgi:hypothetical protein